MRLQWIAWVVVVTACGAADPMGGAGSTSADTGTSSGEPTTSTEPATEESSSSSESSESTAAATDSSSSSSSSSSTSEGVACMPTLDASGSPIVRTLYLVPTDRVENPVVVANLEQALGDLQSWYAAQLGDGWTFRIQDPAVEVVATAHDAAWYATNDSGSDQTLWFWDNSIADAGATFSDPQITYVVYVDADPGCGQIGGAGTSGVTVLPANDIRGLLGEENIPPCEGDPPDSAGRCRWVGGLGHEIGHAFFLPHPPGCDDGLPSCDDTALLWLGYTTYPDAHLTEADMTTLAASPFFDALDPPACSWDCSIVAD